MIPNIVAKELKETLLDYLDTTFSFQDRNLADALEAFLIDKQKGMFKGPFLNMKLPFRKHGGSSPLPIDIAPDFTPYKHQMIAFERLSSKDGNIPKPSLITTGTGSGKTECFLFPIIDHVSRNMGAPGIKAMILYPMNALAFDQARRIAKMIFNNEIKSWPLYSTPNVLPSTNKKVFYIGDAFNGFLPTMAQGAGQSIESAHEIFTLLQKNKLDKNNKYFEERSKRAKIIRKRSNFNLIAFHFSSSPVQKIRNIFLKFLVKRKTFIQGYLGKVYKN